MTNEELMEYVRERCFGAHIPTLETRNSDSLDFHDVGVTDLRNAISLAYELGKKSR